MTVSFASPAPGAVVGASVDVAVDVLGGTDPLKIAFEADGRRAVMLERPPYHATLPLSAPGGASVTLTAKAEDARGASASATVQVRVALPPPADAAVQPDSGGLPDRLDAAPLPGDGAGGTGGAAEVPTGGAGGADAGNAADASVDSATPPDAAVVTAKLTKLTLTPSSCARAIVGRGLQLRAWGDFADGSHGEVTTRVSWASQAMGRAIVGAQTGRVTGVATGKVRIAASLDGITAVVEVTVADWRTGTVEPDALLDDFRGDETGNGAAIWRVPETGGRIGAAYRLYDAAKDSWGALVPLDTGNAGDVEDARIGLNQNSDLYVVWALGQGEVWHSTRVIGQWTSGRLSRAGASAQNLGLALDRYGSAFASWSDPTLGTVRELWAARHTTRDGWAAPIAIASPGSVGSLAFDRRGDTWALWRGASGMASRRFDRMRAAWGLLEPVTGSAGADFSSLGGERLGVDADGNAVAVWLAPQPSKVTQAVASRLERGGSWSQPVVLNTTAEAGDFPTAAAGLGGHMLVAWQQHLQGAAWSIFARAFEPGRGWQEPAEVGPITGSGPHNDAHISIGPDGTTALTWLGDGLEVRFYYPGHGWGDRETVPQSTGGMRPRVVIDSSCNTQVVWEHDGAQVYDTLSARLRAD
jgi:hypothetical protein